MSRIFLIGVTKCQHFAGTAGSVATSGGGRADILAFYGTPKFLQIPTQLMILKSFN
jgi:hypothetical protein